jgi:hypothetical protein
MEDEAISHAGRAESPVRVRLLMPASFAKAHFALK